ncbi:MAG: MG2 domain-containing protein, partial [Armatimonadota bacterium]|nr:MG2 domain-containing protein [Armatimonadota bacterium]
MLRSFLLSALLVASLTLSGAVSGARADAPPPAPIIVASPVPTTPQKYDPSNPQSAMAAGNYKDAYTDFRRLALLPSEHGENVRGDLLNAVLCLTNLGRVDEGDDLLEKVITVHPNDWRVLAAAAGIFSGQEFSWQHEGFIVAGKFYRGYRHNGDGRYVDTYERDRTRALQLMQTAMQKSGGEANKMDLANFYFAFAQMLLGSRSGGGSWRLQYLTDLTTLPDYVEGYGGYEENAQGAPVDTAGNPIFPHLPDSFQAAKTDGERWRWCLHRAAQLAPGRAGEAGWTFASFLQEQFDVQTLAEGNYGFLFGRAADEKGTDLGVYAVRTLREDETLARLASGIKRFTLPDEFNFIHTFQALAADRKSGYGEQALNMLAQIFEDRQQYDRAAHYWLQSINEYPSTKEALKNRRYRLVQIKGNWGQFEPAATSPAGRGAAVDFRFRNAKAVHFEAYTIAVPKLLADIRTYLTTQRKMLSEDRIRLDDLGYRLVQKNQKEYVGGLAAAWTQTLQPRPGHFDRRITITTPLKKAGAYLLRAKMENGNTSSIVLWVADTVIVKKPVSGGALYYVADANTGAPVPAARLNFFGYRMRWLQNRSYHTDILRSTALTGQQGQVTLAVNPAETNYAWLTTASTPSGRLAYLGFSGIWPGQYAAGNPDQNPHAFLMTDRPVYRPQNTVKFKFWLGQGNYEAKDASPFAGRTVLVRIQDPRGTKVFEHKYTADAFGGLDGEFPLTADATLGQYVIYLSDPPDQKGAVRFNYGGGSFRVEEYKKPEFDVQIDAPTEPVMLGEKITATIRANYYFGAPVTHARVSYKVLRTATDGQWYPTGRWDWLFGAGYGWLAADAPWYPGWDEWGIRRPLSYRWGGWRGGEQPEVVLQDKAPIGPDGTLKVEFDTSLAKLVHGDTDHRYEITADVTDASRRTITGTGSVMVARKPFGVYAWVDQGYYHTGDAIGANFSAHTLDNKPVEGPGRLVLLKVTYTADGKPVETPVDHWDLPTGADGTARLQLKAGDPGQYRLSYTVTDAKGQSIEGGYLFTVRGPGFDGRGFRFNDIELIPDKREYNPGDTVHLLINTDHPGSTVALFLRPSNDAYLPPKIIHLTGKSQVETIAVAHTDMPNFFVEGLTIHDAKVFTENREIIVPPESRVLTVRAVPSAARYKPGEKATVQIKITGPDGKPFVGSTVVSLYDKSLDYISGGSNIGDIKAAFWSWKRYHYPSGESSLDRPSQNWMLPGETGMTNLGVFGAMAADVGASGMMARSAGIETPSASPSGGARPIAGGMASATTTVSSPSVTDFVRKEDIGTFTPPTTNAAALNAFWGRGLLEPT